MDKELKGLPSSKAEFSCCNILKYSKIISDISKFNQEQNSSFGKCLFWKSFFRVLNKDFHNSNNNSNDNNNNNNHHDDNDNNDKAFLMNCFFSRLHQGFFSVIYTIFSKQLYLVSRTSWGLFSSRIKLTFF